MLGGSWGSTLALAYAESHPDRVSELVLWGVTTGRRKEWDWWFRGGASLIFPAQWARLRAGVPDGDVPDGYHRLLSDPSREVRERAAREWCTWESATLEWPPAPRLSPRFEDSAYAVAFARLVTHYACHNGFIEDDALLRGAGALAEIPGTLVHGRFDLQATIENAWALQRAWPGAELIVVDEAGHDPTNAALEHELVRATERILRG